jgi:hypothetical protein
MLLREPGPYMAEMMNQPWEPDGLHCWALVRKTVKDVVGIEVPPIVGVIPSLRKDRAELFVSHDERDKWTEVETPGEWAVVLVARKQAHPDFLEHAGVYFNIEGGGIFHADHPHGVVWDSLFEFDKVRRWGKPRFFVPL